MNKEYPAKILLFGEYSILLGSKAFAHPLFCFSGQSVYLKSKCSKGEKDLKGVYNYLKAVFREKEGFIDLPRFKKALEENWSFDSNIPMGHGLGSSGALSAAIYDRFHLRGQYDEETARTDLALIESYFHRKSSGIDPLISLYKEAYQVNEKSSVSTVKETGALYKKLNEQGIRVYLVDSGVSREAAPYVKLFRMKCENKVFEDFMTFEYLPIVNCCVDNFLNGELSYSEIEALSTFQLKFFKDMFINGFPAGGKKLLNDGVGALKLCGAGGGGHYLLFSKIGDEIKSYFPDKKILEVNYENR